ncbi:MAG: AmmeMemoRadiSam system protein B [Minisyncoccia bacterium]
MEKNIDYFRFPAVAGTFYPAQKKELEKLIFQFLSNVKLPQKEKKPIGILVPHAGYIFSGQTAVFAFKTLIGKKIETVVLIGDSHYEYFDGVSIWQKGNWQTPLGQISIDEDLAAKLLSYSKRFFNKDSAHFFEHSLEVQIPFLQYVLNDFKILPILIGSQGKDWQNLAKALLEYTKNKNVLFLASSDLSHYPCKEDATIYDKETINAILSCDPQKLDKKLRELEKLNIENVQTFLCSEDAVKTLLEVVKTKGGKAMLLNYSNSGDVQYASQQVVGYASILFYEK